MAKTIQLEMTTPEKVALQTTAEFVVLPAHEGEMGVLPGHEPFWVELKAGEVRVRSEGIVKSFAIAGGFAEILKNKVSIFAETAEMADEINAEEVRQSLARAKAEITRKDLDPLTLAAAEAAMRLAQVKLRVAEMKRQRMKHLPEGE